MTLRTDHIVGGVFVAFGLVVLAFSGDLPTGSLSFPGAGMWPKLVTAALILFALILIVRAGESEPVAALSWNDLPHALRVVVITAAAIAAYQTLGFLITMTLMLFTLIFGTERRHVIPAAAFSVGVVALTWLLFSVLLKTPLEHGTLGLLGF
jgi:Tripartite tricarboxylate transporter TctB family